MFRIFTRPIIDALQSLGVDAYPEGRNDLLIDDKKFSGNAMCFQKPRFTTWHVTFQYIHEFLAKLLKSVPKSDGRAVRVSSVKGNKYYRASD